MKRDFKTIKNLILLIASSLTLVAVTFSWFSLNKKVGDFEIDSNVSGSTLAVKYFESTDEGASYSQIAGNMSMSNMCEGKTAYYRMDIKTFSDKLIKLIMSFDGLSSGNETAKYVYFDYKLVCTSTGEELLSEKGLKMSDYSSADIFTYDVSSYQNNKNYDFRLFYNVYVKADGAIAPATNEKVSLGEVKLLGQQVG